MSFTREAVFGWWQAAEALAAMPWDGRRFDSEKAFNLEAALSRMIVGEIEHNLSKEFRYRGIRFELGKASKLESGESLFVEYKGFTGDVRRGRIVFRMTKSSSNAFHVTLVATQDKMDRFFRERDATIFEELAGNFSEYVRTHF